MKAADIFKKLLNHRLLLIIAAMLLLGGVFTAGIVWSSLENVEQRRAYRSAIDEMSRLGARNAELEKENETIRTNLARIERQLQVDHIAYQTLTAELGESSSYITELREELDFYQSIISPRDNQSGVRIQDFEISPRQAANAYDYKLTIVQALKHEQSIVGKARVYIEGVSNGIASRVPLADIGDSPDNLEFRYFQIIEGGLTLPEGFEPNSVIVQVTSSASGKSKTTEIERRFDWVVAANS
ncbi:MAG: hypothetical protein DHS20C01_23420 [marine bacterium B5-7]|nr:MAG: hypothetical protein DHS20C01_23420 [marine bacterium B5-7]